MALYTHLEPKAFARIAEAYGLGEVQGVEGIPRGSINTNHRLQTSQGRVFVRHTTQRSAEALQYEAALLAHLAQAHFPGPQLLRTGQGEVFLPLEGGRVSVFGWLSGEELTRAQLQPEHLERLGAELGKLHRLTASFLPGALQQDNPYGAAQVGSWLEALARSADAEVAQLAPELQAALAQAQAHEAPLAPRGAIHADLFLDNVKWVGDRVGALFDFEMACHAPYGLDVAITLNAWCFDAQGYAAGLARALLRGYASERALQPLEREGLWAHALFGAVRFTASRIRDYHLSGLPPERLAPKSFRTYLARVRALLELGPAGFRERVGV